MTNEEKIAVLEAAEDRGWNLVPIANPLSEEYGRLLSNLSQTRLYIECLRDPESFKPADQWQTPEQPSTTPEQEETEAPVPAAEEPEITKITTKITDKTEPVEEKVTELATTEDPKPVPTYDKKEVLDLMKAARRNGINVSEIIKSFGVDNFGDIDAEKYPAVVDALKAEGAV